MEEFRTYLFERSKSRTFLRNTRYLLFIVVMLFLIYLVLNGFPGPGLFGIFSIVVGGSMYLNYEDTYMGITAYGVRGQMFHITENGIVINDAFIAFNALDHFVIYVDEFAGMKRKLFGVHHGGNNEIKFQYKGRKTSIHYIIKNEEDFHRLEKLVAKIEASYPLKTHG